MPARLVLLSVPGLRDVDLAVMPGLQTLAAAGEKASLVPSFPCVTWPVQANMLTGVMPQRHGVVANGFYWRDEQRVEMWTAWNERITAPQIWDRLHERQPRLTSAAWFPMLSKGCGADFVCMPAPVHHPDGSESLWCYTQPKPLYGELRDALGHFPLQNFWGPLASIASTRWIAESAVWAAQRFRPDFFYVYLPHLDYAAQRTGPDSELARSAAVELDQLLSTAIDRLRAALGDDLTVLIASEYAITPVQHVLYPNRVLRELGCLRVRVFDDGEHLDFAHSEAWALVDHQFSHIFVSDRSRDVVRRVISAFEQQPGVAEVLSGSSLCRYGLDHERTGDIVLVSTPDSWQAYYWWFEDSLAPGFARTVDIHRKPGYDPVELFMDRAARGIPLDATLVRGSHGAPVRQESQRGVLLCSKPGVLSSDTHTDTDVFRLVMRQFP